MYTRIFLYWKALVPLVNFCVGTKIIPTKASVYTRDRCQLGSAPHYGVAAVSYTHLTLPTKRIV